MLGVARHLPTNHLLSRADFCPSQFVDQPESYWATEEAEQDPYIGFSEGYHPQRFLKTGLAGVPYIPGASSVLLYWSKTTCEGGRISNPEFPKP